jgi:hypothetical protein
MNEQYIKIREDGYKFYYKDREMNISHREDGPAIEYTNGSKFWFINGRLHREDGPAIEYSDGSKYWYLNGKHLTEEEHAKQIAKEVTVSIDDIAKMLDIPVEKLKIKK